MGLATLGVVRIPLLARERRVDLAHLAGSEPLIDLGADGLRCVHLRFRCALSGTGRAANLRRDAAGPCVNRRRGRRAVSADDQRGGHDQANDHPRSPS